MNLPAGTDVGVELCAVNIGLLNILDTVVSIVVIRLIALLAVVYAFDCSSCLSSV